MIPYNQTKAIPLEDAFEDCLNGGIFNYLSDFEWNPTEDVHFALNSEYFLNRSGRKMASPLVARLLDEESGILVTRVLEQLALVIRNRYSAKWNMLWSTYSSEDSIYDTSNLTKTISGTNTRSGTDNKTDTLKHGKVLTISGTDTTTHNTTDTETRNLTVESTLSGGHQDAHTGTDSATTTRSGSSVDTEGGTTTDAVEHTGTVTDATTNSGAVNTFGFNSSNAVPASTTSGTDSNTRTLANADTTTTTHGKTSTTQFNNLQDAQSGTSSGTTTRTYQAEKNSTTDTGTDTHAKTGTDSVQKSSSETASGSDVRTLEGTTSGTDTLSRTETNTGYDFSRGVTKVDILEKLYSNPQINNFFEIVYSDLDEILTCPIFM